MSLRKSKVSDEASRQGMIDACLSFIYNVGGGNFGSSTLVKKLNAKDYCGAADEFLRWNKAAGKVTIKPSGYSVEGS